MSKIKLPITSRAKQATLSQVLQLCQQATILTLHRDGAIAVIIDDIPGDQRTCFDIPNHLRYFRISVFTDHDAEKNCWLTQYGSHIADIPHRRGLKPLREWCKQTNRRLCGDPTPQLAVYYRRNGELQC
jgi:hypothetical protein